LKGGRRAENQSAVPIYGRGSTPDELFSKSLSVQPIAGVSEPVRKLEQQSLKNAFKNRESVEWSRTKPVCVGTKHVCLTLKA